MKSSTEFISEGLSHPTIAARRALELSLKTILPGEIKGSRGLGSVGNLLGERGSLCVAYFHHIQDHVDAVESLRSFVRGGGGLIAIHGVAASFKGNPSFEALLGARFAGHRPLTRLTVDPCHSVIGDPGFRESFTIRDEPYEMVLNDDVEIWWQWTIPGGVAERAGSSQGPVAWVRTEGAGRVACLTLGHRAATWRVSGPNEILRSLLEWCRGST